MIVRMFKPRFAPLVKSGAKRQTIRPVPKRMPKVGETISCREWSGKPYHSKQRVLREATITEVHGVSVDIVGIWFGSNWQGAHHLLDAFSRDDGFENWDDMRDWFLRTHGLPFEGILIRWG